MSGCWWQVQAAWVATWNCYIDVPQRIAVGQLSSGHCRELVHAGEIVDLVIAILRGHAPTKSAREQIRHELRENKFAVVHGGPSYEDTKDHTS